MHDLTAYNFLCSLVKHPSQLLGGGKGENL